MNNDATFQNAKRLYLEQYGDPMVTNTYLKIALVLVSLVAIGLALVDLRTIRTFQNFRPLVIRIDDLGRAEAINYHNFEYKPQDAEAKYFLSQFCALYYRRNRYTIRSQRLGTDPLVPADPPGVLSFSALLTVAGGRSPRVAPAG